MTGINPFLQPFVDALVVAGLEVHVPLMHDLRPATFVYITAADQPGSVLLQVPDFPSLGKSPDVSVPVRPDHEHGSAVHVDFAGGPTDLVAVVTDVLAQKTVLTRFVKQPKHVAVERTRIPTRTYHS